MQQVLSSLAVGKKIYRKDLIGTPGQIYGQFPQIHFEIVCDEANLRKMIGRAPGSLGNSPARTDAVYGDVWFFVPRGTKLFANEPHPYREDDSFPAIATLHPQAPLVPAGTSRDLVIRMHYEKDCTLTTYRQNMDGSWAVCGATPAESEAEYNLYRRATSLHGRFTDSSLAAIPICRTKAKSGIFHRRRLSAISEPADGSANPSSAKSTLPPMLPRSQNILSASTRHSASTASAADCVRHISSRIRR
ncbi:hypothetical protein PQR57_25820 [Paraburkholderia dipogonis]|uniref:Uncharacterized protein n=1 Tax=Paraburkholderia dipogonis TaxID=1211383 RepID=A0ABW9AWQ7_9BURK